jgi:uncharacterized protein YjiS (DUF1127 family)
MTAYNEARSYPAVAGYERDANQDQRRWLAGWFGRISAWAERQRRYHSTVAELRALSDRELSDIGIGRWQIAELAREAAAATPRR